MLLTAYAVVALIGLAGVRVLTGLAPPKVFGEANLILTFATLGLTMASLPFSNTQLRYHTAAAQADEGDAFTRQVLLWTAVASLCVWLMMLVAWAIGRAVHVTSLGLAGMMALGVLLLGTSVRNALFNRVQADVRRGLYALLLVLEALLTTGGAAVGLAVVASVDGYVVGQAAGAAVLVLLALALTWRDSRRLAKAGASPGFLGKVWSYGGPFAPVAVLGWLNNLADRYVLGALLGTAAVGRYVAPFSLSSRGMTLVNGALADLFRPILFAGANDADAAGAERVFRCWLAARIGLAALGVAGFWLAGPLLVRLLLAPAYRPGAVAVMVWIATGYGVQGVCQTLDSRLMSLDRTRALIAPLALGGVATVAFSFLFIPRGGPLGAAKATTAGFVLQAAATAWMLWATPARPKEPAAPAGSA